MFFNFCDPRLRPEIQCSTISTEGHDVSNLISDNDKGFLAYSCIKPPIDIDITFLCNICINHILIWPYVGSQKSTGFQLYAKTSNDSRVPYTQLCTGFLDSSNIGVMFYPFNVNHEAVAVPPNFLKRYVKPSLQYLTTYISNLRISICKTENSVPALGRIEVWGTVSPRCGKDIVASVHTLWSKQVSQTETEVKTKAKVEGTNVSMKVEGPNIDKKRESVISSLEIPECFLDPITCEIMTQPILLPSGKIIDQTTLQKHEENEALWGRPLSDPFTAISFNENRKPVVATALKTRIDKFLLENSNNDEIKKLPRVLGRGSQTRDKQTVNVAKYILKENILTGNTSDVKPKSYVSATSAQRNKKQCHKLPVVLLCPKQSGSEIARPIKRKKITNSIAINTAIEEESGSSSEVSEKRGDNEIDINAFVPNLKRFDVPEKREEESTASMCKCCSNSIFYQLPCKHVICRKVLLSIENNRCTSCGTPYKTSEVKRIHE